MKELSTLRTKLVKGAFRVMQSPQFVRLLQDKRVLHVLVDGMSLRARTRQVLKDVGERIARTFGLATYADLRALEQDMRNEGRNNLLWRKRHHDANVPTPGFMNLGEEGDTYEERAP